MVVTDVDGNRFLDFAAGIAVCSTGHSHPKVGRRSRNRPTASSTSPRPISTSRATSSSWSGWRGIAPFGEPARVSYEFGHRGGRRRDQAGALPHPSAGIIAFEGGFHGRTLGALRLTNSKIKQRAGFGPLLPMVHHAPFPRVRSWRE